MEDGVPRHFLERNPDADLRHELLVVPAEYPPGTIVGAVVLEYAPVLAAVRRPRARCSGSSAYRQRPRW